MEKHRHQDLYFYCGSSDVERAQQVLRILDDYRGADDAQKLVMFLQYRELRGQFTRIDMEDDGLH